MRTGRHDEAGPGPRGACRSRPASSGRPSVRVSATGHLQLLSPHAGESHSYSPPAAAIWIALQQHSGEPRSAAATLARCWDLDADELCLDLELWLSKFRQVGLVPLDRRGSE